MRYLTCAFLLACLTGGCGTSEPAYTYTVRGAAIYAMPANIPVRAHVDAMLDVIARAYWHKIDWTGLQMHFHPTADSNAVTGGNVIHTPYPSGACLSDTAIFHQTAHWLRAAHDHDPDVDHEDTRYFMRRTRSYAEAVYTLEERPRLWHAVLTCGQPDMLTQGVPLLEPGPLASR